MCKYAKGLKIHQARIGCRPDREQSQCTDLPDGLSGETQENHIQDEDHSAENLHNDDQEQAIESPVSGTGLGSQSSRAEPDSSKLKHVKWPAMDDTQWRDFDTDVNKILEQVSAGTVVRKQVESMTKLIYAVGEERFGLRSSGGKKVAGSKKNRRQLEIERLRRDLRNLKKQYVKVSELEKIGLQGLRDHLRSRLKELSKAERIRTARKEKTRKRARFLSNPYGFVKETLEQK